MSELKDPAIKLFGKTIPLCPPHILYTGTAPSLSDEEQDPPSDRISHPSSSSPDKPCISQPDQDKKPTEDDQDPETSTSTYPSNQDAKILSEASSQLDDPKTPSVDKEPISPELSNNHLSDAKDPTTLTKPDKLLPCPRCNSMETKFCYFNNYNVNQPRHFCRNCQRYWTAGGTMRSVPVGSGRRKTKTSSTSSSHFRPALVMDGLQATRGTVNPVLRPTNVIAFGSDAPPYESINSTLNFEDSHQETLVKNFQTMPPRPPPSPTLHLPYFAGPLWPIPWRAPNPAFCPPGFPTFIYPAPPFWGCMPIVTTSNIRNDTEVSNEPSSPLGKHCRDGNVLRRKEVGGGVLVHPKTLRIEDPNEAAKSSIWSTLGIKHENLESTMGGVFFKPLNLKGEVEHVTPPALQANPVALSRSQNFHEKAP